MAQPRSFIWDAHNNLVSLFTRADSIKHLESASNGDDMPTFRGMKNKTT